MMYKPQNRLSLALLLLALPAAVGAQEAKPVLVVNDPGNPVPIRDTENPAHIAFQVEEAGEIQSGFPCGFKQLEVPRGKRLVIETVSLAADVAFAGHVTGRLLTTVDGRTASYRIKMTPEFPPQSGIAPILSHFGTAALRLYADPPDRRGGFVECLVCHDGVLLEGRFSCSISGYLVDHP
jgi:hypothetical protein